MKTRRFLLLFVLFLLFCPSLIWSQSDLLFTNSQKIDQERYEDILDSPYLLDDWLPGKITDQDAEQIEAPAMNYNAHSHTFEVRKGERFIELDPTGYVRIVLTMTEKDSMVFQKPTHPAIQGNFMQLLYEGEGQLFKQVESKISKKTFQDVGKTREVERFVARTTYHWVKADLHKRFKMSKKSIIKTFGNKKEVEAFLKKNKLKLSSDENLARLFAHLDRG